MPQSNTSNKLLAQKSETSQNSSSRMERRRLINEELDSKEGCEVDLVGLGCTKDLDGGWVTAREQLKPNLLFQHVLVAMEGM